jgi:type I restriction enzyme, S subunit
MNLAKLEPFAKQGWNLSTVGDAAAIRNNLRYPISEEERLKISGDYPYFGPTGVLAHINEYRIEGEHVLIGEDGDHFLKFRDKPMTLLVSGQYNVNNHAHVMAGTKKCETKWLHYFYMHADLTPFLTRQGVGRFKLTKEALSKTPLLLPPLPEQRKIANILSTWDEAVTQLDALIEAQERRKKALMQQLLTGRRRLKGFSKPWKHKRMDAVFQRVDRAIEGEPEYVLSITAGRGFVDQREKFSRVIAGRNIENYVLLKKGEFSYNKGNSDRYPQGCVYRLEEFEEGAVPNVWISFRLRSQNDSPLFYKHFFLYGGLNHGLHRLINAGVRNDGLLNLTASNFFSVTVPTPEPEEQAKLGDLFENLSISIKNLRDQRAALDQQKRGLMQRLLTGKLRVKTK